MFSQENGLPELKHVLYPRFPSFVQAASFLSSIGVPNIYNVTILYYKVNLDTGVKDFSVCQTPRLLDFLIGKHSKDTWHISVHIEKFSLVSIGISRRNLEKWLEKVWFGKEKQIKNYIFSQENNIEEEPEKEFNRPSKKLFRRRNGNKKRISQMVSNI